MTCNYITDRTSIQRGLKLYITQTWVQMLDSTGMHTAYISKCQAVILVKVQNLRHGDAVLELNMGVGV